MVENDNVHRLYVDDKEVILIGTAHVSRESADLVGQIIEEEKPDTVCVELCQARYESLTQKSRWQETDLFRVIREKKASLLLLNLLLVHFQKRIGKKLGIKPGEEMARAIQAAEASNARIHLVDRDIRVTLLRAWRSMSLWTKIKLLSHLMVSVGEVDEIKEEDVEKLKRKDALEVALAEIAEFLPEVKRIVIDERDQYLAHNIKNAPGEKIVAVVGAGHVPGIQKHWDASVDVELLDRVPPKGNLGRILKWGIPIAMIALITLGFFTAGRAAGTDMIRWWIIANALLAGLGATLALGHPVTILTAVVASPLTSLSPMIAAGWVSGAVEALIGKPKVRDFESLTEDITSMKGFWRNRITRILLVVVFTNLGSALGTFVAIPLMVKVL